MALTHKLEGVTSVTNQRLLGQVAGTLGGRESIDWR